MSEKTGPAGLGFEEKVALGLIFSSVALLGVCLLAYVYWGFQ